MEDERYGSPSALEQLVSLLARKDQHYLLLLGAPGMGKSSILRQALGLALPGEVPRRLVCSAALEQVRFGILAPYLSASKSSAVTVPEAVHDVAANLAPEDPPSLVVVEEGHHLDAASAYVLTLLATMEKIRLVVVSTDLDPAGEINEILLANAPNAAIFFAPMNREQLHHWLVGRVGREVTDATVETIFRLTGGIHEIAEAVVDHLIGEEPAVPSGTPWALRRPVVLSGRDYRFRMQELVSRLAQFTIDIHRDIAAQGPVPAAQVAENFPAELTRVLRGGYLRLDDGMMHARSSALVDYVEHAFRPVARAQADSQPTTAPADAMEHAQRLLERKVTELAPAVRRELSRHQAGRHLMQAAAEIAGRHDTQRPDVTSPDSADSLAGGTPSEQIHRDIEQQLDALSTAFTELDLGRCHKASESLKQLDEHTPGLWYPRARRLVESTLGTLHHVGPSAALQQIGHLVAAAPPLWREHHHGLIALCRAIVHNAAADFVAARSSTAEAVAEFSAGDPQGLLVLAQALHASLESAGNQGPQRDALELLLGRLTENAIDPWIEPLWLHVMALLMANGFQAPEENQQVALCTPAMLDRSAWVLVPLLTIQLLDGGHQSGAAHLVEHAVRERTARKVRARGLAPFGSPRTPRVAHAEHLQASGHLLAAYLVARNLRGLPAGEDAGVNQRVARILTQVETELNRSGRKAEGVTRQPQQQLSDREYEVARLAKQGVSNREIAAQLFLSRRTVEGHLYRAFRKLAITTRDELRDLSF